MKHATALVLFLAAPLVAAPPVQTSVETVLGPKLYRDGDVVEITDVLSTSPRLEQGDTVTVKGRVRLDSRAKASLCLFLTQTEGDGHEETEARQRIPVLEGIHEFELKTTIKHQGKLHVTLYDGNTGRPFGGTYFGTVEQMNEIADWNLNYYLND